MTIQPAPGSRIRRPAVLWAMLAVLALAPTAAGAQAPRADMLGGLGLGGGAPAAPAPAESTPALVPPAPGGTEAPAPRPPPPLPGMTPGGPPPLPAVAWFYDGGGRPLGPVPGERLRALAAAGSIGPATLVWRQGMAAWTAAGAVPELAALFTAAGAGTPPALAAPAAPRPQATRPPARATPPAATPPAASPRDWTAFIVGAWQADAKRLQDGTPFQVRYTFAADGSFSGVYVYPTLARTVPFAGRYEIRGLGGDSFAMTIRTRSQRGDGGEQVTNDRITRIDADTLRTADGTTARRMK